MTLHSTPAITRCILQIPNNHRIQVLNSDLTFFSTIGGSGDGEGQFSFPSGIACDSAGKVYVADCGNHRIQILTAEGKFLRAFGGYGRTEGQLEHPRGSSSGQ